MKIALVGYGKMGHEIEKILLDRGIEIVARIDPNCEGVSAKEVTAESLNGADVAIEFTHPNCGVADTRLLNRMRRSAVSAVYGAGMHPDRELWVPQPREAVKTGFVPSNRYRDRSGPSRSPIRPRSATASTVPL